jgi:hypothetical protein
VRLALFADGYCWGYLELLRDRTGPHLTTEEAEFLLRLSAPMAKAIRAALTCVSSPTTDVAHGPGTLILDAHDTIQATTPEADQWLWPAPVPTPSPSRLSSPPRHPFFGVEAVSREPAEVGDAAVLTVESEHNVLGPGELCDEAIQPRLGRPRSGHLCQEQEVAPPPTSVHSRDALRLHATVPVADR